MTDTETLSKLRGVISKLARELNATATDEGLTPTQASVLGLITFRGPLGLTELAYAAFEAACGISKPDEVVAVQRETRAVYYAPLNWREGVTIEVTTSEAGPRGFTQEFSVRSQESGRATATGERCSTP